MHEKDRLIAKKSEISNYDEAISEIMQISYKLHKDIVLIILSFISFESRNKFKYHEFNPFSQNKFCGLIEFLVLLLQNACHYIIYILLNESMSTKVAPLIFICCAGIETIFIIYWYGNAYYNRGKWITKSIYMVHDMYSFYNRLYMTLNLIYLVMLFIVLIMLKDYPLALWLFFGPYAIGMCFQIFSCYVVMKKYE